MTTTIVDITAVVGSIKAAIDIVKGIQSVKTRTKIDTELGDLLGKLVAAHSQTLSLQTQHESLIKDKHDLEKKILEFDKWEVTQTNYALEQVGPGVFVYVYHPPDENPKQNHWACPKCWKDGVNHVLQRTLKTTSVIVYTCPNCKIEFTAHVSEPWDHIPPPAGDWRVDW
jgi:hypothetical protein